jgi:hypothetical protein
VAAGLARSRPLDLIERVRSLTAAAAAYLGTLVALALLARLFSPDVLSSWVAVPMRLGSRLLFFDPGSRQVSEAYSFPVVAVVGAGYAIVSLLRHISVRASAAFLADLAVICAWITIATGVETFFRDHEPPSELLEVVSWKTVALLVYAGVGGLWLFLALRRRHGPSRTSVEGSKSRFVTGWVEVATVILGIAALAMRAAFLRAARVEDDIPSVGFCETHVRLLLALLAAGSIIGRLEARVSRGPLFSSYWRLRAALVLLSLLPFLVGLSWGPWYREGLAGVAVAGAWITSPGLPLSRYFVLALSTLGLAALMVDLFRHRAAPRLVASKHLYRASIGEAQNQAGTRRRRLPARLGKLSSWLGPVVLSRFRAVPAILFVVSPWWACSALGKHVFRGTWFGSAFYGAEILPDTAQARCSLISASSVIAAWTKVATATSDNPTGGSEHAAGCSESPQGAALAVVVTHDEFGEVARLAVYRKRRALALFKDGVCRWQVFGELSLLGTEDTLTAEVGRTVELLRPPPEKGSGCVRVVKLGKSLPLTRWPSGANNFPGVEVSALSEDFRCVELTLRAGWRHALIVKLEASR